MCKKNNLSEFQTFEIEFRSCTFTTITVTNNAGKLSGDYMRTSEMFSSHNNYTQHFTNVVYCISHSPLERVWRTSFWHHEKENDKMDTHPKCEWKPAENE